MARGPRSRGFIACLIPLVVLAALCTRWFAGRLPPVGSCYGGDTLWATTAFLVVGMALPAWGMLRVAALAFALSCVVEVSQLYHAPWIDALRNTTVGGLLLGYEFLWSDLLCYFAGVLIGMALDAIIPRQAAPKGG